jgi:hypothetical protein
VEGNGVKAGDTVRLIGIPSDIKDDREMHTRSLFEKCVGRTFPIAALETVDGLPEPLVRLDVGHILGEPSCMHTIWVEPRHLLLEDGE